jgi:multiple sugar transport system substrate-binding protein
VGHPQLSQGVLKARLWALALMATLLLASMVTPSLGLAAQSEDPVTLTLWMFEGEEQLLPALEAAYEEANPNVDLSITMIPEDNYVVKLDTAMAAGSPPDLGFMYDRRWVKAGKILPLDDMVAAKELDLSGFNPAIMEGYCTIDGKLYCLGSYTGAVVLIYNKAMFDAAGLEYPSATEPMTIDKYAELAAALTQPSDDITQQVWGASAETPFWWMDRATMFSEDGRETLGFVNDDATKHTYEVLGNMVAQGHAPSGSVMQSLGSQNAEELFRQGKLGMVIGDFAQIAALEEAGVDYGVATLPVEVAGDPPYLPVWTDSLAVFADSPNPEAAMDFLAFMATEGQRLRVEVTGEPPLDATVAEELGWVEKGNVTARQQFLDVIAASQPLNFVPGFWDVTSPLDEGFNLIAAGEVSASDMLDDAAPRMQDSLDQAWRTWEEIAP